MSWWTNLTQPQATVLMGFLNSIIIPFLLFAWSKWKFGSIQGEIAAAQKSNKENTAEIVDDAAPQTAAATSTWNDLRSHWARVREKLMEIAFDQNVDGRTRAAYSRIDLRGGYVPFVNKLKSNNMLGANVEQFEKAANLWERYRRNRAPVDEMVVKEMKDYADALA